MAPKGFLRRVFPPAGGRRTALVGAAVTVLLTGSLTAVTAGVADASGTPVLGDLSYQTYDTHSLADRQNVSVNVADGNLIFQSELLNIAGTGLPLSITQTFNNLGAGAGQIGNRDTLSVGSDVHVTANGDGSATYQGPSGFQVVYPSNGSGGYTVPAAYTGASLAKVAGGGWTLTLNQSGEVYTFNSSGNQTKDATANGEAIVYSYNNNGTLASATDSQGRVVTFGNYTGTDVQLIQDPTSRGIQFSYTNGNLAGYTDAAGHNWQMVYSDGAGNLNEIADPNNNDTVMVYNSAKQVTSITYDSGTSTAAKWTYTYNTGNTVVTDPLGHATTYTYNNAGSVTSVLNAVGDTYGAGYDANNNQTSYTSPSNETTKAAYNQVNSLLAVQNPTTASGAAGAMTSSTYGNAAHPYLPSGGTDAQGNQVAYSYDTNGNLMSTASSSGGGTGMGTTTQTIQGDPAAGGGTTNCSAKPGEVCTSTDADGNVTTYGYDANGNLTSVTPPGPVGKETIAYDNLSRVSSLTAGNGTSVTVSYDSDDRPAYLTYSDGTHVQYSYDNDGNLGYRTDAAGTTEWTYNGRNQITQIQQSGQATLNYTYDTAGNLLTETGPAGTTTYTYDHANQIAGMTQTTTSAAETFTFAHGRPVSVTMPGGVVETIGYDNDGRETSITAVRTVNGTPTTLTSFTGSYTTVSGADSDVLQSETNVLTGLTTKFGYDGLNRLSASTATGAGANSYTYTYDNNGNRTGTSHNGTAGPTLGYNPANELVTSNGAADGTYDQSGNQTATGAGLAMAYNAKNQTTTFTPSGQAAISEAYTDTGQTGRTTSGATTEENGVLGVYSDTTAGTATYYTHLPTGTDQVLTETIGANTYYYLTDLLGSTIDLTNSSGTVMDTYTYDPYGNTITSTGTTPNPWQYAGGYHDPTTGLYKFGARYYNPADARWTQLDPSGQNPGYIYAGDDPVNETDPSGLDCVQAECERPGFYANGSFHDGLNDLLDIVTGAYVAVGCIGTGAVGATFAGPPGFIAGCTLGGLSAYDTPFLPEDELPGK